LLHHFKSRFATLLTAVGGEITDGDGHVQHEPPYCREHAGSVHVRTRFSIGRLWLLNFHRICLVVISWSLVSDFLGDHSSLNEAKSFAIPLIFWGIILYEHYQWFG
jgi:hypothetical protein